MGTLDERRYLDIGVSPNARPYLARTCLEGFGRGEGVQVSGNVISDRSDMRRAGRLQIRHYPGRAWTA